MNQSKNDLLREELRTRIENFVSGNDRSKSAAGRIEVLLDELYEDLEPYASLMLALASYEPAGGPFLFDEKQIVAMMTSVLDAIR